MKKLTKRTLAAALALMMAFALCAPALAAETSIDDGLATRGDVVKWLYSAYKDVPASAQEAVTFTDVTEESGAVEAAAWAAGLGIAKGYGDGRFGPDDLVTREQASAMCYRFAQAVGQGFRGAWMFLLDAPDANEISDWANEAMHWVVMTGVITGRDGGELAPKDYIGINELPLWMRNLDDALNVKLENGGFTLSIPADIAPKLNTEMPADVPEGTLFTVAEQASIDAAKAKGYDGDGMGWLFAIQKVSADEARRLLCADMSGKEIFAKDGEDNYFVFCHPTDVRFDRETTEQMTADSEVWANLNKWAGAEKERFINDNGLTAQRFGNSDVEIALYRAAYDPDAKYTLSTTQFGPLEPAEGVDAAAFVERALAGVTIEYAEGEEAPDGEYVVLKLEDDDRIDFFTGAGGNCIRRVVDFGGGETHEYISKAVYDDGETVLHDVMEEWYLALASAHGKA